MTSLEWLRDRPWSQEQTLARLVLVLGLCAAVVLAGCSMPLGDSTADPTETATPTDPEVEIVLEDGFDPDYNVSAVLERVERLRGLQASGTIYIETFRADEAVREERPVTDNRFLYVEDTQAKALQLYSNETRTATQLQGYVRPHEEDDAMRIHIIDAADLAEIRGLDTVTPQQQETILAHEFVHVLQHQHDVKRTLDSRPSTTDAFVAGTLGSEGDASVVTQQYRNRYVDTDFHVTDRNVTSSRRTWAADLPRIQYYHGYRHFAAADMSPAERNAALGEWPTTTAAVLLDGAPDAPVGPIDAPAVEGYEVTQTDRIGFLVMRFALRTGGVPYPEAQQAAEGWRNDQLAIYADGNRTGVVWTTRWADAGAARAFEQGWRSVLDRRNGTRRDGMIVVPATDDAPAMYYAVERDGETVTVVAAQEHRVASDLASAAGVSTEAVHHSGSLPRQLSAERAPSGVA